MSKERRDATAAKMLTTFAKRHRRHAGALAVVVDADGALTVCSTITHRAALAALMRDALETIEAGADAELVRVDSDGRTIERAQQSSALVH